MNFQDICERWNAVYASVSAMLVAFRSIVRGLSLFISASPKTPLRVMCIMAFDTLHLLRNAKPMPMLRLRILAALLDFGACANAVFDNKNCCWHEWCNTLQLLEEAGLRSLVVEYLRRLADLECRRPLPGGDCRRFEIVALYRKAVVRLSLGMVATTANGNQCLDEGIRATYCDADLNILFRIVMQCQIIDDVLDYSTDMSTGLPSFLTACNSLPQAFELTRLAALGYADDGDVPRTAHVFPLRSALFLVSTCTRLAIVLARWGQRTDRGQQFTERVYGPRLLAGDGSKRAQL